MGSPESPLPTCIVQPPQHAGAASSAAANNDLPPGVGLGGGAPVAAVSAVAAPAAGARSYT